MKNIETKIADFIETNSFSFELDGYLEELDIKEEPILFSTRDNGDVGSETFGQEDLKEALDLKKRLLKNFEGIEVEVDTCDEWVHIAVSLKN